MTFYKTEQTQYITYTKNDYKCKQSTKEEEK